VANVTVFVDDAVCGTLPPICVKEGVPTDDRLTMRSEVGGGTRLGIAWLLVLAGPLGWLALVVIALMRRPSDWLTVRLPLREEAYQRYRLARRMMTLWFIVAFTAAVVVPVFLRMHHFDSTLAAITFGLFACAALVAGIWEWRIAWKASVKVELDASRRWVTLSGVHPSFVEAVQRQLHSRDQVQGAR
jgi:hypothetical protein